MPCAPSCSTKAKPGIAALTRLTARDAQRIVGALSREDAARILDRIAVRAPSGALSARVLWERSRDLRARDDDPNGWLLALIAAERDVKGSAAGPALSALSSFRSLRAFARAAPEVLAAAIASGAPIDALERCGVDAEGLRWLDADMINEVCKGPVEACGDVSMAVVHDTPHGGALLLRVVLERTDWRKQWRECVHGFNEAVEDVLAWMIVTRAIASGDARPVRDDAALRLLLPDDSAGCVEELSGDNAIAVEIDNAAASLMHEFARRLPGCEGASADWLRTNVLSFGAHVTMHAGTVQAVVGRPPLDVLLVLGGWKRTQCRLADGRVLTLREVPS